MLTQREDIIMKEDGKIQLLNSQIMNIDLTGVISKDGSSNNMLGSMPSIDTLDSRAFASFRYTDDQAGTGRQGTTGVLTTIDKENDIKDLDSTFGIDELGPMPPKPKKVSKVNK